MNIRKNMAPVRELPLAKEAAERVTESTAVKPASKMRIKKRKPRPFLAGASSASASVHPRNRRPDQRHRAFRFSALDFPRLGSAFSSKDTFCPSANP
jgi:hypothetical protein